MSDAARRDPTVPLLLLISLTTGLVDAVSVLGFGKVFTANMTGNIVFLGFALAGVPGFSWALCLVALAFFLVGAGAGGRLSRVQDAHGRRRWLLHAAVIETALLWIASACGVPPETPGLPVMPAMVALTAAAMGFRNATVRHMKVADLTTTVLTLTLTGLAADSPAGRGGSPNVGRRIAAVVAILLGALIGAALVTHVGLSTPLALAGAVTLGATVALARDLAPAK